MVQGIRRSQPRPCRLAGCGTLLAPPARRDVSRGGRSAGQRVRRPVRVRRGGRPLAARCQGGRGHHRGSHGGNRRHGPAGSLAAYRPGSAPRLRHGLRRSADDSRTRDTRSESRLDPRRRLGHRVLRPERPRPHRVRVADYRGPHGPGDRRARHGYRRSRDPGNQHHRRVRRGRGGRPGPARGGAGAALSAAVNPSGGNLFADPGNASGFLRILQAAQQVRGTAGAVQVHPRPRTALAAAVHGFAGQGAAVVSFTADQAEAA